ncbi:hypothetical protein D3C87_1007120 [compost metagenome]
MLIKNGNFHPVVRFVLVVGGIGIAYLGAWLASYWVGLLGVVICGIGGYASKASAVGIKPFQESVKKNKHR